MRDIPSSLMLFAAGFGTRMRPLTDDRPKPLVSVAGRPLIDHALALAAGQDLRIVANAHYRGDQIAAHLEPKGIPVLREDSILDTGGGLRNALPHLGEGPIFTLNTDAVWLGPPPLPLLAQAWDPTRMDALLLCVPVQNAHGYSGTGDFTADSPARRGPGLVYSGLQIMQPNGLHDIEAEAFSLNLLWDRMIAAGRLHVLAWDGLWCDVGRPESVALAEELLNVH